MSYGKGCRPSPPEKLARRQPARAHAAIAHHAASPPASASLAGFEPLRLDQDGVRSCTAHSIAAGLVVAFAFIGRALGWIPSPDTIYRLTRALERALGTPVGAQLPVLQDTGADLADVITVLAKYGIIPMGPSSGGRNSDCGPETVALEPDLAALEQGASRLVVGEYGIDVGDLNGAAAAIAAGFPLYIAFFCDAGFEAWKKGDAPYGAPNQNDPNGGGHAVIIDAYTTNPDGSRTWRLVNSWGIGWGDGGMCLVSDAFMKNLYECWALDVSLAEQKGAA